MTSRRIVYASALIFAAFFSILYPYWFSTYLFVVLLLLAPLDLILSLPGMLTRRILLTAPSVVEQGADVNLAITTLQKKSYPARCLKLRLCSYGEDRDTKRSLICGAQRGSRREVEINSMHSGVTVFYVKRIWIVSLIGFFALPVDVRRRASVLVMPTPQKPPNIATLPRGLVFVPKPGGGFSEDYDLRQYREGDQIRSVHWKLSAKVDSLVVREPLEPPPHSRLVEVEAWNSVQGRDLVLGRLRWISDYLLQREMPFYLRIGKNAPTTEIRNQDNLIEYVRQVLEDTPAPRSARSAGPSRFSWVFNIDMGTHEATQEEGGGESA